MTNTRQRTLIIISVIFVLLFISGMSYGIFLYMDLNKERTAGHEETEKELLNQTNLTDIIKIENFNGEEPYHVVYGEDEDNEKQIVFYPLEGNEKTITTVDASEVISDRNMLSMWQEECNSCELVKITPALLEDDILWELVYYDEENRYVFDYRSIYDGSQYEEIRYLRTFD